MGFEKTEDKQKSAAEGFETDVVDLDGGSSEGIRAVKAPRRSSRKEPRFGLKRDRLGRKETNTDDSPDSGEMVAPVRPVRLSGSGGGHMGHLQKPVMKEGSDFAYLFTDQDEDQNDRHMDREKASRLDGLAYDEKTDGDGEKYSELFAQTAQQPGGGNRRAASGEVFFPASQERNGRETANEGSGGAPVFTARKSVIPEPAQQETPQEATQRTAPADNGEEPKKRSLFNRHSRSAEKKEEDGAPAFNPRGGRTQERDARDAHPDDRYRDDRYDRYHDDDRYRDDRGGYDRYYDRDRDDRRYDRPYDDDYGRGYDRYDDYDRRYDRREEEEEAEYRRHSRFDRYRREQYDPYEPEPYEAEPIYPPAGYQVMPGMYPSMMGGYQPVYYTPAPIAPIQPVQYVQGTGYVMPVQGAPYQGVSVTGVPVQGVPIQTQSVIQPQSVIQSQSVIQPQSVQPVPVQPAPVPNAPAYAPEHAHADSAGLPAPETPAQAAPAENGTAAQDGDIPETRTDGGTSGSRGGSRFNRRGSHDRSREAESAAQAAEAAAAREPAPQSRPVPQQEERQSDMYRDETPQNEQPREERTADRGYEIPSEDSIPHFRPRSRQHDSAQSTGQAQPERTESFGEAVSDGELPSESKPAEPRFRRRHN